MVELVLTDHAAKRFKQRSGLGGLSDGEELYILVAESQRLSKQQRKYMHAATTSSAGRMFLYHKPTNLILVFGRSNVKTKPAAVLITVVPYEPKRERYKSRSKTPRKWKKRD